MKNITLFAVAAGALALSACAPRYYDDRYRDGYYQPRGHAEYTDRGRYNDPYYARDRDQLRDRDYRDRY